ncbi:hypothetical protein BGW38_006867 [Lunasporangiospora selenospora]|uniref:Protein YTP1-like C-terminal domain-containing protein n=1 Tax=Lunasporangiospora selenospora TaxID=979761 RepID=A0A9P6G006_9FUNG|nr:hypothetical protein BGW38_006867 [Lunasporangiospora selenospora]
MPLGIRKHKMHIPLMAGAILVAICGYFFGYFHHLFGIGEHAHDPDDLTPEAMNNMSMRLGKRQVGDTSAEHYGWRWGISAHGALANFLLLLMFIQVGMGVYRKMTKGRPRLQLRWLSGTIARTVHSYIGKAHLVLAYVQIVLGCIKLLDACPGQAFGQCISHIVMGGSFWWYGGIYLAYLVGSFPGVTRPEWYESIVMTVWGVINFSILHQWGTRWSHADLQHTSMGLLWVGGGILSIFLESKYNPLASFIIRKNPIPALLIVLTGYGMGQHSQYYVFATTVHTFFGYCLMLGGVCRLIQLALRPPVVPIDHSSSASAVDDEDDATLDDESQGKNGPHHHSDQYPGLATGESPVSSFFGFLSALGVISAGLLFQSAHEEQLNLIMYYLSDASTYINWIMALAFFTVFFILFITQAGKKNGRNVKSANKSAYNRLRTQAGVEERGHSLSDRDIELSGFLDARD